MKLTRTYRKFGTEQGIALIPTLLVVSGLAVFMVALLATVLTGKRTVNLHSDEHRLSSAVESAAMLASESIWSRYLADQGGNPGTIVSFRQFMDGLGVTNNGVGGPPSIQQGADLKNALGLPVDPEGQVQLANVNLDALRVFRRDVGDATQLYVTVSATTNRGEGIVNPALNRAVQQAYTIEPADFDGFEYAMLANNVNCIFCHTNVDSVERWFNTEVDEYNSFERIRVGTLESFMIRHDMDGNAALINDFDADSYVAGSLLTRGTATDHDGTSIADWSNINLQGYAFDTFGNIVEDTWGQPSVTPFVPAGSPPGPLENLYLEYPDVYSLMTDGPLPTSFPAPIPDDGGIVPGTGQPDPLAIGNRIVDDIEFQTLAAEALGEISAGVINVSAPGTTFTNAIEYANAFWNGNADSVNRSATGNVILTGQADDPITIDGTVAIDGDLIINGYIRGEGSLIVRGNVYIPTDLQYYDGTTTNGNGDVVRSFGIDPDGFRNALGLTAGGNVLIGDFYRPSILQADGSIVMPAAGDMIEGNPVNGDGSVGAWSFSLAEMSIFNRAEWARTQEFLPASSAEAAGPSSGWTASNPGYDPAYVPRYYGHGPGDVIPIYNKGELYYDVSTGTWRGDSEVPMHWDSSLLSYADPTDPTDPFLFAADGSSKAVTTTMTPTAGWISDTIYKAGLAYMEARHPFGEPMKIDGLLYTNNAIFTLVSRYSRMVGRMVMNGSLVAADLGMLVPGIRDSNNILSNHSPNSNYAIGLQLNYDKRVKDMLNVKNPNRVQMKRTLWNPTANIQ